MGDTRVRELAADREPGLTGADNDNLDPIGHPGRFYAGWAGPSEPLTNVPAESDNSLDSPPSTNEALVRMGGHGDSIERGPRRGRRGERR